MFSSGLIAQEICDNGIDDNNNGLVDLNDTACICAGIGSAIAQEITFPNASFENFSCCPQGYSSSGSSDYLNNCLDSWVQGGTTTPDFWNSCGAEGSTFDGLPSLPAPDGNGYIGFINMAGWQEYAGVCLNTPLYSGSLYTLSFYIGKSGSSIPDSIVLFGTNDCQDLPFSGNDCPLGLGNWTQLGSTYYDTTSNWVNANIQFQPNVDIDAITIGAACGSGAERAYYYMDGIELTIELPEKLVTINSTGHLCNENLILTAEIDTTGGQWQWYSDGIAIENEVSESLNVPSGLLNSITYSARYQLQDDCAIGTFEVIPPTYPQALIIQHSDTCQNVPIEFIDNSTIQSDSIVSWNWDFGDNSGSNLEHPMHNYSDHGVFDVELIVESSEGCSDTTSMEIEIFPIPFADFNLQSDCSNLLVNFFDVSVMDSSSSIAEWNWDFGDGNSSSNQDPSHFYTIPGTYLVDLAIVSNDGCSSHTTSDVIVKLSPDADFTFTEVCLGYTTNFHDFSLPLGGSIVSWQWDFGDGNISIDEDPIHIYSDTGEYTVQLLVIDINGCADSLNQGVEVFLCSGIDDPSSSGEISIFPNPITDKLNVVAQKSNIGIIKIYNGLGQIVFIREEISKYSTSIELNHLSKGNYVLEVVLEDESRTRKRVAIQ